MWHVWHVVCECNTYSRAVCGVCDDPSWPVVWTLYVTQSLSLLSPFSSAQSSRTRHNAIHNPVSVFISI